MEYKNIGDFIRSKDKKILDILVDKYEESEEGKCPLYIKYFDYTKRNEYPVFVGRIFVSRDSKVGIIESEAKKLANIKEEEEVMFYEEIRYKDLRVDLLDKEKTFKELEIGSGDIITFQIKPLDEKNNVVKFYENVLNTRMGRLIIPPTTNNNNNNNKQDNKPKPSFDNSSFVNHYGIDEEESLTSGSESKVAEVVKNGLNDKKMEILDFVISSDHFDVNRIESKISEFQRKGEDICDDFDRSAKQTALDSVKKEKDNLIDQIVDLKLKYEVEEMEKLISDDLDVEIFKTFKDTIEKWKSFFRKYNNSQFNKTILGLETKIKKAMDTQWTNLLIKRNEIDQLVRSCEEGKELLNFKKELENVHSRVVSFKPFKEDKSNSFACPYRIAMESLKETSKYLENKIDEYIL